MLMLTIAGAYLFWKYTSMEQELAQARQNVVTLSESLEKSEAAIESIHADIDKNMAAVQRLNSINNSQQKEIREMRSRFSTSANGQPRDLGNLAEAKSQAIERLINRGSEFASRCIELSSGAEHTAEELAATKPSEINTVCPRLANPNFIP